MVIGIGEQNRPIRWQIFSVNSKAMVLSGDEAALGGGVDTGEVVTSVTIPIGRGDGATKQLQ